MAEVTASFMGRPILARHRDFSLYRPTSYVIAKAITDIPNLMMQVSIFSIVFYFMAGLQMNAARFFTYWLVTLFIALTFSSMFRMIGSFFASFNNASKVSGFWIMCVMVYAGFMIPVHKMHVWFRWIRWINPGTYGYEALLANEFKGLNLECVGAQLIPNGLGYTDAAHQTCTVPGVVENGSTIIGDDYVAQAYSFHAGNIWRNFGTHDVIPSIAGFFANSSLQVFSSRGGLSSLPSLPSP
jgi:ATP-binding cassette subfamily G (WHITE) protein 2 (SNQ2)